MSHLLRIAVLFGRERNALQRTQSSEKRSMFEGLNSNVARRVDGENQKEHPLSPDGTQ